jgi:GT2 family glycosyltransferase
MDLSIIIVNWNTRDFLCGCLRSVYQTIQGLSFEVIVVDNASRDGSTDMLRKEFPDVLVIENEDNRGFGAANNQALRIMKGRHALLLNTDTVLTEGAVQQLFSFLEQHTDAAMACGQLLNEDGGKQNSIAAFPTLLTLLFNTALLEVLFPERYPSKRQDYKEPIEVDSGIGACLMVRKDAIDRVGLFDERYFFFLEETDWALRMKKAGWKIYFVPSAFIYHFQGQSIGHRIESRIAFYRSRYAYFRKWHEGTCPYVLARILIFARLTVNWLAMLVGNAVMLGMNKEARKKWKVYSQLVLWHLKGCP